VKTRERDVLDRRHSHARVRFETERQDRDYDKEHGHRGRHLHHTNTFPLCYAAVPIGRTMCLIRPSARPSVPCGLLTEKKQET